MTLALYAVTSLLMLLEGAHGTPDVLYKIVMAGGDYQIPAAYGMQGWELASHRWYDSDKRDDTSSFASFMAPDPSRNNNLFRITPVFRDQMPKGPSVATGVFASAVHGVDDSFTFAFSIAFAMGSAVTMAIVKVAIGRRKRLIASQESLLA